jgi:hypothetical protein
MYDYTDFNLAIYVYTHTHICIHHVTATKGGAVT